LTFTLQSYIVTKQPGETHGEVWSESIC